MGDLFGHYTDKSVLKLLVTAKKLDTCSHRESSHLNKMEVGKTSNEVITFSWKLLRFNKPVNSEMHRRLHLNIRKLFGVWKLCMDY